MVTVTKDFSQIVSLWMFPTWSVNTQKETWGGRRDLDKHLCLSFDFFFFFWMEKEKRDFCVCVLSLYPVWPFATPWTIAHQAPLSMGILQARILEWLPCPLPGDLPNPGVSHIAGRFFTVWATREDPHDFSVQFSSVVQSCPTLRPHESQHTRPPCP